MHHKQNHCDYQQEMYRSERYMKGDKAKQPEHEQTAAIAASIISFLLKNPRAFHLPKR